VATILSILEGASTDAARAMMFDYLGQPWFIMGSTLAKMSICLFFVRLVGGVRQWVVLLVSQLVLIAVLNLAFAVTTNAQCAPVSKLWNPSEQGTCWDPSVEMIIGIVQGGTERSPYAVDPSLTLGSLLRLLVALLVAVPRHDRPGPRDAPPDAVALLLSFQLDPNVGAPTPVRTKRS